MKVAVTGGTGYVGPAVIEELIREGHTVVAIEHRTPVPLEPHGRLLYARGSVSDLDSLRAAFEGCDAVVHLVAIIREDRARGITFEKVHVRGTQNVVDAAKAAGVRRFVLMSANGVESDLDTPYFETKREMERMVKDAGFDWTIFRPSYVAGSRKGGFDDQFARIVDRAPVLPSFAGGKFEIQPVSRRNVGEAFARALADPKTHGKAYTLVGPERFTWNDYLRRLARLRRHRRIVAHVPRWAALSAATTLGPLFPADADQLRMLMAGNVGDASDAVQDLKLDLETWASAVAGLRR